jgi:transposase
MDSLESTRLEQFRQFKSEIRGSERYLIVGLDIAKDSHHAFFGTATGHTLWKRWLFDNSREGFQKLLLQTEALQVRHGLPQVVFGLEPTANYHKPLGEYLIRGGHQVVFVSGVAVKRNRELLDGRWDKHDTKDAANVADLISQGKCLYYEHPDPRIRDLRILLSLKKRWKRQEQGLRVRIRNGLVAQYCPELDPSFSRLIAFGKEGGLLSAMQQTCSIGCAVHPEVGFAAKLMVQELQQARESLKAIQERIQKLCSQFSEYPYLLSIPGFGPQVSSQVLAAIGDPFRFAKGSQVLKMAGLDLSADRSGKTSAAATPVISKKGKANLRYALYQAALIASIKNPNFMAYYTGKLRGRAQEKGIQTKMRVKLAAKLLLIAWTLMKRKEPFDPKRLVPSALF